MKSTPASKMTTFKQNVSSKTGSMPDAEVLALALRIKNVEPEIIQASTEKALQSDYNRLYNIGLRLGVRFAYNSGMVGSDFARKVRVSEDQDGIVLAKGVRPILVNDKGVVSLGAPTVRTYDSEAPAELVVEVPKVNGNAKATKAA